MSDHIEVLQAMLNEEASRLSLQNYEREAIKAAISSLRQVPDAKPLADRLPRESECTAEAAHYFYAQGWNACRDAFATSAQPTSVERRFRGVGELERSGYIPEGSAAEREANPAPPTSVDDGFSRVGFTGVFVSDDLSAMLGRKEVSRQVHAQIRSDVASDDPHEFGAGIEDNPKAKYWQQRAAFWRSHAVSLGYVAGDGTRNAEATPAQAGAELPEPAGVLVINGQALRGFTADQMRAYAELARRGGSDG